MLNLTKSIKSTMSINAHLSGGFIDIGYLKPAFVSIDLPGSFATI